MLPRVIIIVLFLRTELCTVMSFFGHAYFFVLFLCTVPFGITAISFRCQNIFDRENFLDLYHSEYLFDHENLRYM